MLTYETANKQLNAGRNKYQRKIANHTHLIRDGEDIVVRYHATYIIRLRPDGTIILSVGRWQTVSTRDKLNKLLRPEVDVYQKNHVWYVVDAEDTWLFEDGMYIQDGLVHGAEPARI